MYIIIHVEKKSRGAVQLLVEEKLSFSIREYLKEPLSVKEVLSISQKLGLSPGEFIRKNEVEFKENNLKEHISNDLEMAKAISKYPKIMERPIVIVKDKALICRPPEKVLTLLKQEE